MDPAVWRSKTKMSLRELAKKLGCTRMTVLRYETGEREAPNSVVLAYERESRRQVTGEDLNRVRKRFLRRTEDSDKAA